MSNTHVITKEYKIPIQRDMKLAGIKHPETFCAFPFFQLAMKDWLKGAPFRVGPCCNAFASTDNPLELDIENIRANPDLNNIFHGEKFDELRTALLAGKKHKACSYCWKLEEEGSYSPRLPAMDFFYDCADQDLTGDEAIVDAIKHPTIKSIDTNFDNNCNLACRMCSPSNSRKLSVDFNRIVEAGYVPPINLFPAYKGANYVDGMEIMELPAQSLSDITSISHTLTGIKIAGGEPTISKHFWDWMDYVEENDLKKNISMHLTTNGTKFNSRFIEALKNFRQVELIVSIDAVGKVYDYIRHPFSWDLIKRNVERLYAAKLPNVKIDIVYISTNIGLSSIPEMLEWANTMPEIHLDVNLFVRPEDGPLSPKWIPKPILEKYIADIDAALIGKNINTAMKTATSLNNLKHFLTLPIDSERQQRLKRYLILFDKSRNQDYHDYLDPLLSDFLDTVDVTEEYLKNCGELEHIK